MRSLNRISFFLPAAIVLAATAWCAERPGAPRFHDPQRRARLAAAFPEIEKLFEQARSERGIPGLAFGIVIDGELAYVKGIGVADRATNAAVTPDTAFRIASMTKSFTALCVLQLRDDGKLSLDDPVSKWIPEAARFDYPSRDAAPLRVRHLLTHSAGFPEDNPWGDRQLAIPERTMAAWLQAGLPFSTSPGTAYEYSNYGFALLGRIVAKASGMPYREYLEKRILAPLGMKSSNVEPSAIPSKLRATGYGKSGETYTVVPSLAHGEFGAMGGLVTSARDLGKYVAFHLSAWPPRDGDDTGPVRRSSVREMQTQWRAARLTADRPTPDARLRVVSSGYGYGLSVSRDCRFDHIVSHGGGLPGFGSFMLWLPEHGVGIFEIGNLTYAGLAGVIDNALDVLNRTGALQPRELAASGALVAARDALVKLWRHWDDGLAARIAADNLFQDRPAAERKAEIARIAEAVGACGEVGEVEPENLLRGHFNLACERGSVGVEFTLAPTMPPTVQHLVFTMNKPLDARMRATAAAVAALIGSPSDEKLHALAAPSLAGGPFKQYFEPLHASYGSCRVGERLAGDGTREARVRLDCDRGRLDLRYRLDASGKLESATFARAAGTACVP
jgi:CubicO group peptidase (beta-lactamase class C family)